MRPGVTPTPPGYRIVSVRGPCVADLSILPRNVCTGGNFGCSAFVMAVWHMKQAGKLPTSKTGCKRHTDGGSDNVTKVSHFVHFLLVWIGCFNVLEWFRFEPGHSHTEITDRLFSMMRHLFETVNGARAKKVESFAELCEAMDRTFKDSKEGMVIGYHLANWDWNAWMEGMAVNETLGDDLKPARRPRMISSQFAGIKHDYVFRYEYVGRSQWRHGGVRVLYKGRLSDKGDSRNAEYGPVREVTTTGTTIGSERTVTETLPEGVVFVMQPPNLSTEPSRERFSEKMDIAALAEQVVAARRGTHMELSAQSEAEWSAFKSLYQHTGSGEGNVGALPSLPTCRGGFNFDGLPRPLLPILKDLCRFPRPLITWDLFTESPPSVWQDVSSGGSRGGGGGTSDRGDHQEEETADEVPLRSASDRNTVTHEGYTKAEREREVSHGADDEWADGVLDAAPPTPLRLKELYVVRIADKDGDMRLGIVEPLTATASARNKVDSLWFGRKGKAKKWSNTPTFEHYGGTGSARVRDEVDLDCFLLRIDDTDLTESCRSTKLEEFRLSAEFTKKLRAVDARIAARQDVTMQVSASGSEEEEEDEEEEAGSRVPDMMSVGSVELLQVAQLRSYLQAHQLADKEKLPTRKLQLQERLYAAQVSRKWHPPEDEARGQRLEPCSSTSHR